ncbi:MULTISPECIES: LysR family transcriptional regulator [unclassified Mesorhizobium]|uniref:LysR family transcriptional regulator n=1 Tax=unclassified Mesorhizobium TaxID=325217 RepID=UPI000FDA510A|nr:MULTISPECIES: LysR family transcriptional regulator [unclassified Mesorhizobium]TGR23028.1 LysR family transcriptional regulator [Mesorhizobium sp. M8A.F.Ca.ET.197.01.1.1]TGR39115.1 LysR family transcriptional regulator [bacterium M00.F.Ca.ET.199.01.1.1]TGR46708.1 LysR family transcriptional regulator [Mesorhizobium sp. M8A.F.Ca.ET.198.01.1.1]TGV85218.1 LysR family transcriptional regulator [Mesorhizobium sp. M00.F.Ca.ET.149.01.1.1]
MRTRSTEVDPKKLMYYATVIEQGSIKKASRVLKVSQPALSTSMNKLEEELGLKLVVRSKLGVVPTPFGVVLYSHARKIREEVQLACNCFRAPNADRVTIQFGCVPSLACNVVPAAIAQWRKNYPDNDLRVADGVQFELLNKLLRGEIDLFVGYTENYELFEGLRQRVLFRDRLFVAARPTHPLFSRGVPGLEALAEFPWVFVPPGPYNVPYENVLESYGIRFMGRNTVCDSIAMLKSLIAGSDHLGLLPAHAAGNELADGRLALLPTVIPEFNRSIAVFSREGYEMETAVRDLISEIQAGGVATQECRQSRSDPQP